MHREKIGENVISKNALKKGLKHTDLNDLVKIANMGHVKTFQNAVSRS